MQISGDTERCGSEDLSRFRTQFGHALAVAAATQTVLDDAAVDVEEWIGREVETVFAETEGDAFINGDGTTRPQGFLTPAKVANASWSWGNIGYLATGVSAGFAAANPSDSLIDLIYSLKSGYRQGASFVMNRKTQSQIRRFKDSQGAYLWQPPASLGQAATLMNFPIIDAEQMPDIAANSYSLAFGDFRRGYLILDRQGVRVLRDPYTAKPMCASTRQSAWAAGCRISTRSSC